MYYKNTKPLMVAMTYDSQIKKLAEVNDKLSKYRLKYNITVDEMNEINTLHELKRKITNNIYHLKRWFESFITVSGKWISVGAYYYVCKAISEQNEVHIHIRTSFNKGMDLPRPENL